MREQFNLNSVISLIIGFVNVLMVVMGTFLWGSISKALTGMEALNQKMATQVANQEHMQSMMQQVIPRGELELKFKMIDVELIATKARIQQIDAELIKLRKDARP